MVFRFNEDGGFKTEDGLSIAASGVFSKVSFESEIDENLFLWASGVLSKDAVVVGLDELIWCNSSSTGCFLRSIGSSLPFVCSLLVSALEIAINLLRMEDGALELEQ